MGAPENTCALKFWLKPSVLGNILAIVVFFVFLQTTLIDRSLHTSFSFWTYASEVQLSKIQTADSKSCRSTQGGKTFVADDKGYVCLWEKAEDGCCTQVTEEDRFVCGGCNSTLECCLDYELCVSCCLSPKNRPNIVQTIANTELHIFKEVTNSFDFCVSRCRTSSHSLLNHKTYKSPEKHCFGKLSDSTSNYEKLSGSVLKSMSVPKPLPEQKTRNEDDNNEDNIASLSKNNDDSVPKPSSIPFSSTTSTKKTPTLTTLSGPSATLKKAPTVPSLASKDAAAATTKNVIQTKTNVAALNDTVDEPLLSRVFVRNITHGFGLQLETSATQDILVLAQATAGGERSGTCGLMSMLITLGLASYFLSLYSYCSSDQVAWPLLSKRR